MTVFGRNLVMPVSSLECLHRPIRMPKADRQETITFRSLAPVKLAHKSSHRRWKERAERKAGFAKRKRLKERPKRW